MIKNYMYDNHEMHFGEELSDLEIKIKLENYIRSIGFQLENFEETIHEIMLSLNNAKIETKDNISTILNKWLLDGTIKDMVENNLKSKLSVDSCGGSRTIDGVRLFRVIRDNENGLVEQSGAIRYAWSQGFCRLSNGNCLIGHYPNGSAHPYENSIQLTEYSENGNELRSVIVQAGHCNSIAVNELRGEIYLAKCFERTQKGKVTTPVILVLDYSSFEVLKEVTLKASASFVAYDNATNNYYFGNGNTVNLCDSNFNIIRKITLSNQSYLTGKTTQTQTVYNNCIYKIVSDCNVLLKYDMQGNLLRTYNIPNYLEDAYYSGECEDISVDKDDNVYTTFVHQSCNDSNLVITNVFKFNLSTGTPSNAKYPLYTKYIKLYVGYGHVNNPRGLTTADSFDLLSEAIEYVKAQPSYAYSINIAPDSVQPFCYISGVSNIMIEGNGALIHGIRFALCSNVILNNVTIIPNHSSWIQPLGCSRSYGIKLNDVLIPYISTSPCAITIDSSTIEISGVETCALWGEKGLPYCEAKYNCSIVCSHDIENIYPVSFSGTVNPSFLRISKAGQTCGTVGDTIELTEIVKKQGLSKFLSRYRCIVFSVLTGLGGIQTFKLSLKNRSSFNITYSNLYDDLTGFSICEMNIDIVDGNLKLVRGKTIGFKESIYIKEEFGTITDVYLTNEL